MKIPELLVPAGDLEKLATALNYGADAVYLGMEQFGLRALAGNFTLADLRRALALCHSRKKRLYLTLNAYLRPEEFPDFESVLEELRPMDIDAYIVSDPGVIATVRRVDTDRSLHLSTQANTTNAAAVNLWTGLGIDRVNLARELTLDQIAAIRKETDTELEVFVHGAMCVAYSGRCLLSAALSGREANRGLCAHPCRWGYALVEETRPGRFFPIEQDARGTYLLNSHDLCLLDQLPALVRAGVDSCKIEGRMKSLYYVAAVTRVYRAALDYLRDNPECTLFDPHWRAELDMVSHRPYGTGFLLGSDGAEVHADDSAYIRSCDFVGIVRQEGGRIFVEGRNRFFAGEELELIGPGMRCASFSPDAIRDLEGRKLPAAQPNMKVVLNLPASARPGDLLRRPVTEDLPGGG